MPFATIQTVRVDSFVPVVQSIICCADLITAVFLFAQYSIQPRPALLALASGYILGGLFAFLQTLDFPGAYSATGLISGTPSGAVWLFSFWRILFPLAVITYVLLKDVNETASPLVRLEPGRAIALTVACVLAVAAGLTWIVAVGTEYLPTLFVDQTRQLPSFKTCLARCGSSTLWRSCWCLSVGGPSSMYGSWWRSLRHYLTLHCRPCFPSSVTLSAGTRHAALH